MAGDWLISPLERWVALVARRPWLALLLLTIATLVLGWVAIDRFHMNSNLSPQVIIDIEHLDPGVEFLPLHCGCAGIKSQKQLPTEEKCRPTNQQCQPTRKHRALIAGK